MFEIVLFGGFILFLIFAILNRKLSMAFLDHASGSIHGELSGKNERKSDILDKVRSEKSEIELEKEMMMRIKKEMESDIESMKSTAKEEIRDFMRRERDVIVAKMGMCEVHLINEVHKNAGDIAAKAARDMIKDYIERSASSDQDFADYIIKSADKKIH